MKFVQVPAAFVVLAGLVAATCSVGVPAPRAWAQEPMRLAQQNGDQQDGDGDQGADPASLLLRINRLENQLRSMTGQIEQLQFQNKRLEDNLRKMQQDVDFRFQDLQAHPITPGARPTPTPAQRRGDADVPADDAAATAAAAPIDRPAGAPPRVARQTGDAFDPDANPDAPGAPRPLGTTTPSQPLPPRTSTTRVASDSNGPLDLMHRTTGPDDDGSRGISDTATTDTPSIIAAPRAASAPPNPNAVASLTPGGTREEYDADIGMFRQGQFDSAASNLQSFIDKYPKDRLMPDAVYMLGESYSRLGRHREAAEQFLKLSTDYGKSPRAPDALLRLGMSLGQLGAKEQACATYQEVNRKYPTASADVRASVDRELKRAHCQSNG